MSAPDERFREPYHGWGRCERCRAKVPPSGAFIGFWGKVDQYPRWCRECVVASGDAELLADWDDAVATEAARRQAYRERKAAESSTER